MAEPKKQRPGEATLVWERREPAPRPAPEPLSRDRIVRVAIEIADAEGLASVSLRKVADALGAGPMRLYGYLSTKAELLELMVDVVYGEMAPATQPSTTAAPMHWRDALRSIAQCMRAAARRHGWFIELLGGRPHQGPNALAHLEATLSALSGPGAFDDIDDVMQAARTVNAYVIGALQSEASEGRAERDTGLNKAEWQAATGAYLHRMIATGRFPTMEKVVRDATHPSADIVFEQGLDWVLDAIAVRLAR